MFAVIMLLIGVAAFGAALCYGVWMILDEACSRETDE